ncbi:MAG: tetratricopeptide repeat protein [Bacteroidales bacterium]|nr:tetratricopeptide repeat protein [Bacteroidales bacterium]
MLLFISFGSFSQDYKNIHKIFTNVYYADSLYKTGNYETAVKYYKKAINEDYIKSIIFYNLSECYYYLNDTIESVKYYTRAIKSNWVYLDTSYITNNEINIFLNEKLSNEYIDLLYKNCENYNKLSANINEQLRQKFLYRKELDQQFRGRASSDSIWAIQKKNDVDNQKFLDSVINVYGYWTGIDLIGEDGATAAFLFAQHADDDVKFQKKCLTLMKKGLKNRNINPQHYAMLVDRIMLKTCGFQLFGSQCIVKDNKYIARPLYDAKIVNTLRKHFNMSPLENYLENMTKSFININIKNEK